MLPRPAPRSRLGWRAVALLAALTFPAGSGRADEGQWPPGSLGELDARTLRSLGLRLPVDSLWKDGAGLMAAAVNLSGCSSAFVSSDGLLLTNHHCAYRAVQANSTPERNLLRDGFVALRREDELPAPGFTARVLLSIRDVTREVRGSALPPAGAPGGGTPDDAASQAAAEREAERLAAACEGREAGLRCEVVPSFLGARWELHEYREFTDLALVYAPAAAVGEYGGEVDNYRWPRHTGDFALLRVLAPPAVAGAGASTPAATASTAGAASGAPSAPGAPKPAAAPAAPGASAALVGSAAPESSGTPRAPTPLHPPYHPRVWLRVSAEGVRPGAFVAVLGYPGRTFRHQPFPEVARQLEVELPLLDQVLGEWLGLLAAAGARSPEIALKVAPLSKSLANRRKNAQGKVEGARRQGLQARREREHEAVVAWATRPDRAASAAALTALTELGAQRRAATAPTLLLELGTRVPSLVALAVDVVRLARERERPDAERELAYRDRNLPALRRAQERRLREHDPTAEAELLAAVVERARSLPAEGAAPELAAVAPRARDRAALVRELTRVLGTSELRQADAVKRWMGADLAAVTGSRDPLIALALALLPAVERADAQRRRGQGLELRVAPDYVAALRGAREGPLYPDANGTLRLSYATVKGYAPEDGLLAVPQSTLRGAVAKHTGRPPFDLPEAVRQGAPGARDSAWADSALGDVPVAFLSNADTTGGNSGSPLIDGEGRVVGLNFDRVWENVGGDYGYSTAVSRNISVDIRYLLWMLDRVHDAGPLLGELGVLAARERLAPGARAAPASSGPPPAPSSDGTPAPRSGCVVGAGRPADGAPLAALGALLLLGRARRRTRRAGGP